MRGERSENVETWNVGASHVDDGGDQSFLGLGILRSALLKIARQTAEVATHDETPEWKRGTVKCEINAVFQDLQHGHVGNRLHFVVKPTRHAEAESKPGVSLALHVHRGILFPDLRFTAGICLYGVENRGNLREKLVFALRDRFQRGVVGWTHQKFGRRHGERVGIDHVIAELAKRFKGLDEIANRVDKDGLKRGIGGMLAVLHRVLFRIRRRNEVRGFGSAWKRPDSERINLGGGSERGVRGAARAFRCRRGLLSSPCGARCGAKRRGGRARRGLSAC